MVLDSLELSYDESGFTKPENAEMRSSENNLKNGKVNIEVLNLRV